MKALLGFAAAGAVIAAVLLFHGTGHGSSPLSVSAAKASTAACQAIQGTKAHALPAGSDPTATMDSKTCVIDFGIPEGAKGPTGPAGQREQSARQARPDLREYPALRTARGSSSRRILRTRRR